MSLQFLRKVIVDIRPQTGNGISIGQNPQDLRINFKCLKTNESTPNTAQVEFYNLSERTRNILAARNTVLQLTIGYQGLTSTGQANNAVAGNPGLGTVFIGNVTKVKHDKKKKFELAVTNKLENTDLITSVDVGDGDNQYRNAYLDKGYPAGTKLLTVINDLIASTGLTIGPKVEIPDYTYTQGFATTGLTRSQLDYICDNFNLEWSIQDQTVQVISKTGNTNNTVLLVSPQTGLVHSPNLTSFGVEFTTLCDHRLLPGRQVQLTSKFINGGKGKIYKIRRVTHHGSNWNGDYVSDVQATVPVVYS